MIVHLDIHDPRFFFPDDIIKLMMIFSWLLNSFILFYYWYYQAKRHIDAAAGEGDAEEDEVDMS